MDITVHQGANSAIIDPALVGDDTGLDPRGHQALGDYVRDELTIDPTMQPGATWPAKLSFLVNKAADRLHELWLEFTVTALTTTGGTYRRLVDLFGYLCIDHIDYWSNNQVPQTVWPPLEDVYRYFKENDLIWRQTVLGPMVGGDLTDAQRSTLATAAQTFRVPLRAWFSETKGHGLVLPAQASQLRIDIFFKTIATSDLIQTDGTAPVITFAAAPTPQLRAKVSHVDQSTRARWVGATMTELGLTRMFEGLQMLTGQAIAANTQDSGRIQLPNLTAACSRLVIFVRPATAFVALSSRPTDFRDSLLPTYINWKVGNSDIWHQMPVKNWLVKSYSNASGRYDGPYVPIIEIPFDELPQLKNTATGHLNLQNLQNHSIQLLWDAPGVTENVVVDFISFCKNWVQEQGGRCSQVFRL